MVWSLLVTNAVILVLCFVLLWAVCLKGKDVTPVDSFWAFGMVVMAISSFFLADGLHERKLLLLGLCALWGIRLGSYMLWRWRDHGTDRRYVALLGKAEAQRGWSFAKASALLVFATQAPLLFIVCLPVQLGQVADAAAARHAGVGRRGAQPVRHRFRDDRRRAARARSSAIPPTRGR